jgi:hypothetical protein
MSQEPTQDLSKTLLHQAIDPTSLPSDIQFLDITMRDGAHVVDFSNIERLQLATCLGELGVHRIEISARAYWSNSFSNGQQRKTSPSTAMGSNRRLMTSPASGKHYTRSS